MTSTAESPRALGENDVHLWYVYSDRVTDPALLDLYRGLMSPEEAQRQARFYFQRDRHQFLVTRGLIRLLLSEYVPVPPREWKFAVNHYGRPEISAPPEATELRFNLSHTRGMAILGVARGREIGVDVEDIHRRAVSVGFADRYFSPLEVADLTAQPVHRQAEIFFDYWTLKESYIKARGMGLSLPLEKFSFHLRPAAQPTISIAPELDDDPNRWEFFQFRRAARYQIALAIERPAAGCSQPTIGQVVPGRPLEL